MLATSHAAAKRPFRLRREGSTLQTRMETGGESQPSSPRLPVSLKGLQLVFLLHWLLYPATTRLLRALRRFIIRDDSRSLPPGETLKRASLRYSGLESSINSFPRCFPLLPTRLVWHEPASIDWRSRRNEEPLSPEQLWINPSARLHGAFEGGLSRAEARPWWLHGQHAILREAHAEIRFLNGPKADY